MGKFSFGADWQRGLAIIVLDIISSGCKHKKSTHDRFGPEECDDCAGVLVRVWVIRERMIREP